MNKLAAVLFFVVICAGLIQLRGYVKNRRHKVWVMAVHGAFAWSGLAVLLLTMAMSTENSLFVVSAMLVLITNFIFGLFMLARYITRRPRHAWMVTVHIFMGSSGFVLLLIGVFLD